MYKSKSLLGSRVPCMISAAFLYDWNYQDGSSHPGSAETNLTRIHEDSGSIPGLTQWIKDLPWAVAYFAHAAWICCHCSCGMGQHLQLQFDPRLGTSICHSCALKRQKKKKNRKRNYQEWNLTANLKSVTKSINNFTLGISLKEQSWFTTRIFIYTVLFIIVRLETEYGQQIY